MSLKQAQAHVKRNTGRSIVAEPEAKMARTIAEPEKPEIDMSDPGTQHEIMAPFPKKLALDNGYEITLHEPSAKLRRFIFGFIGEASSAVNKRNALTITGEETPAELQIIGRRFTFALASLLSSDAKDGDGRLFQDRMFDLTVQLYDKAGRFNPERAGPLVEELSDNCTADDLIKIYATLAQTTAVTQPKN